MKLHMIAFGGDAQDFSAGLVTMPFIADPLIRASSNVVQLSDDWYTVYAFVGGVGLTRVRLSSASSRIRGYPNLFPFTASHLGGSNPQIVDMRDFPIDLKNGENVTMQATNGGAQATVLLIQLGRGGMNYNINAGGLRWIRWTCTLTSVAYQWGPEANIVLDDDIEAGNYNVWDFNYFEADAIAGRLVFKDQVERPGCIANQVVTDAPNMTMKGGQGLMGTFNSITPPFFQSMHVAAASQSLTGYMLVSKA